MFRTAIARSLEVRLPIVVQVAALLIEEHLVSSHASIDRCDGRV